MGQVLADRLACAADYLEETLAGPLAGRENEWATRLDSALAWAEGALLGEDGPAPNAADLTEPDRIRPTFERQVDDLDREKERLLGEAGALRGQARTGFSWEGGVTVADFEGLRRRAEKLLADLRGHRERMADLLLEAFVTDLGAGD